MHSRKDGSKVVVALIRERDARTRVKKTHKHSCKTHMLEVVYVGHTAAGSGHVGVGYHTCSSFDKECSPGLICSINKKREDCSDMFTYVYMYMYICIHISTWRLQSHEVRCGLM